MNYKRYHIHTESAPDIVPWPTRFKVQVKKAGLAKLILTESIQYKGDTDVVLSRPCLYGVFSGPIGGFAPIEKYCVGCLRCTTQYPDWVTIRHNPERRKLGDSYFTFDHVNALDYESSTGNIPVKGAGYRGKFGGEGWDGMWTDMSEIVRPTRDGIHGREFISTVVDIGSKPGFLTFNEDGGLEGEMPETFSIPVPFIFDTPATWLQTPKLAKILAQAAADIESLAILPVDPILDLNLRGDHVVPIVTSQDLDKLHILPSYPRLIEMDGWNERVFARIKELFPNTLVALRLPFDEKDSLMPFHRKGISIFHLTADYHGLSANGDFVLDMIRAAHKVFVDARIRQDVTLLGSGGIVAAEHVPKAIIAGLDVVVLDTPLLVAMQARFEGDFTNRFAENVNLPKNLSPPWGIQRLKNMAAAWRDQLLEILGAMGIREVRRLRGEIGRAMFMKDLEKEAFADIEGYGG